VPGGGADAESEEDNEEGEGATKPSVSEASRTSVSDAYMPVAGRGAWPDTGASWRQHNLDEGGEPI
jgi:hypothetical protein